MGRQINLRDKHGNLLNDAHLLLLAHVYYPESVVDREIAYGILKVIAEVDARHSLADKAQSSIAKSVFLHLSKKNGQHAICGLVSMAMCYLARRGRRPSLESAAKIVSAYAYDNDKVSFSFWDGDSYYLREARMNADVAGVKTSFRSFRSVSHICAARIVLGDLDPDRGRHTPAAISSFVKTTLAFQRLISASTDTSKWRMWDVEAKMPIEVKRHHEALDLSGIWQDFDQISNRL
jgi:hypothetical protein